MNDFFITISILHFGNNFGDWKLFEILSDKFMTYTNIKQKLNLD